MLTAQEPTTVMNEGKDDPIEKPNFRQSTCDEQQKKQRLQALLIRARKYAEFLVGQLQQTSSTPTFSQDPSSLKKKQRKDSTSNLHNTRASTSTSTAPLSTMPLSLIQSEPILQQPRLMTGGQLCQYQLEGVQWLVSLYENGLNGILADEMGLGKTIQCIGFLAFLREQGILGPFLIVAPLSTLPNWVMEFQRFAPSIVTLLYHGSKRERAELQKRHSFYQLEELLRKNPSTPAVIVTSYELAMKDIRYLAPLPWKYMIIDEGHRLKNLNCRLIHDLKTYNSANRLLLTGTPFHNNLTELWSLLNFLLPHIFADLNDFLEWFDIDVEIADEEERREMVGHLHAILKPMLLRRLKVDVEKELPPKRELVVFAQMTPLQIEYYQKVLQGRVSELIIGHEKSRVASNGNKYEKSIQNGRKRRKHHADTDTDDDDDENAAIDSELDAVQSNSSNSSSSSGTESKTSPVIRTMAVTRQGLQNRVMQLRKVCNHPYLFNYPVNSRRPTELLIDKGLVEKSGKMRLLDQLLPELFLYGHKVLLFSQMSRMLDMIEDYLVWRGYTWSRIDGSVSMVERQEQMRRFNQDPNCSVFLLSTRAGGLGLNLTAADTVIFYDSDWNPQMDLQAQDRAHRIGQTKPVLVLRLAMAKTIEEHMLDRAANKRKLERLVMHKRKFKGRKQLLEEDFVLAEELLELLRDEEEHTLMTSNTNNNFNTHDDLSRTRTRSKGPLTPEELDAVLDRSENPPPLSNTKVACTLTNSTI